MQFFYCRRYSRAGESADLAEDSREDRLAESSGEGLRDHAVASRLQEKL